MDPLPINFRDSVAESLFRHLKLGSKRIRASLYQLEKSRQL